MRWPIEMPLSVAPEMSFVWVAMLALIDLFVCIDAWHYPVICDGISGLNLSLTSSGAKCQHVAKHGHQKSILGS